jgi:hypothetical protein
MDIATQKMLNKRINKLTKLALYLFEEYAWNTRFSYTILGYDFNIDGGVVYGNLHNKRHYKKALAILYDYMEMRRRCGFTSETLAKRAPRSGIRQP